MSDFEMRKGMRLFLYPGGAENMDVDSLLKVRDRCIEVLKIKKVPQGKVVHYIAIERVNSQVACKALWVVNTTEDNATEVLPYVTCGSCKKTNMFRKAMGEDVKERSDALHFDTLVRTYWDGAKMGSACNNWIVSSSRTKRVFDVTCGSCMRTKSYKEAKKRSDAAKKGVETRKKKEVVTSG